MTVLREGGIACAYDINNAKWIAHPHITMKDQWQCYRENGITEPVCVCIDN